MAKKKSRKVKFSDKTIYVLALFFFFIISIFLILRGGNMIDKNENIVVIETNKGVIEIELYKEDSPITVENFLSYVNEGFYDGTIFHRVIPKFMIQGGGFLEDLSQKEKREPIKNEADNGLKNEKYTLAMARTNEVDSATSQFFINTADNEFLDNGVRDFGYAVFGKVVSGFEIVDEIEKVETTTRSYYQNVPVEPIIMTKVYLR
jgi:peptidyl-prolyl cis-trans isomerase A (cyclophilin A)